MPENVRYVIANFMGTYTVILVALIKFCWQGTEFIKIILVNSETKAEAEEFD